MVGFVGVGRASTGGNAGASLLMNGVSPDGYFNVVERIAAFDRLLMFAIIFSALSWAVPKLVEIMANKELHQAGLERIADAKPLSEQGNARWNQKASGEGLSFLARLKYEEKGKMGSWDPQRDRDREAELERDLQRQQDDKKFQQTIHIGKKRKKSSWNKKRS